MSRFAANTLHWRAPQIRAGDEVRSPYGAVETAPIDERDIAAVAVRALSDRVPQNYQEAFRLLTKAADRGASRPSVWLGTMYEGGLGVPADVEKARQLYQRGAERGELFGCIFLARLLASGRLGSVDQSGALRWYRAALNLSGVAPCAELDEARAYVQNRSEVGA